MNVGCEKVWPYTCFMGGFPGDIHVKAFKVCDDASDFDKVSLAEHAGKLMQAEIDKLYQVVDASGKAE